MDAVDCCVPPVTNGRQGNQLVATAFNIPLNPGGDGEVCWSLPVSNYKEGMFPQGQHMQTDYLFILRASIVLYAVCNICFCTDDLAFCVHIILHRKIC